MTVLCFKSHWKPEAAIVNGDDLTPNLAGEAYLRLVHSEWSSSGEAEHSGELAWQRRVFRGRCCTVLYCTMLYFTVLHCTALYCTVLTSWCHLRTWVTPSPAWSRARSATPWSPPTASLR